MSREPRVAAIATAVPTHRLEQPEIERLAEHVFDRRTSEIQRLLPVYANAGIESRYSCVPVEWFFGPHGWRERNALYLDHALELTCTATRSCLAEAGCATDEIDALVVVSTTGIATPSLDALLIEQIGLRPDVARLPIFGLGCAGGVLGLAPAAAMAREGRTVLFVVVELCALTFRQGDASKSNIIASALFGDGAAAMLIRSGSDGPALGPNGSHTWPHSLDVMGWTVEDDGLGVLFSRDIPSLVRRDIRAVTDRFLAGLQLSRTLVDHYICHPGGTKVIEALEDALELGHRQLGDARAVLRGYGNMSAVTVLFVLERHLRRGLCGRALMLALGPGFTAGFQILET
jgi:alkylresorcinol/alkylpyrone synthase